MHQTSLRLAGELSVILTKMIKAIKILSLLTMVMLYAKNPLLLTDYEINQDSIDVFININNETNINYNFYFDKINITRFHIKCTKGERIGLFFTDASIVCNEFPDSKIDKEKISNNIDSVAIFNFCNNVLNEKIIILKNSKNRIFIDRLNFNVSNCDSLDIKIKLNKNKYRFELINE